MRPGQFALVLACVALMGCATVPNAAKLVADGREALQQAPLCCVSLQQARMQPLPLGEAKLVIDTQAQAFDFGGNKAFFLLYELPAYVTPYSVALSSKSQGSLQDSALFIPRVAVFDANYKLTRYFDEKTLRNRGNDLERTVFFNPGDAQERYLAIYGSDLSASVERAYSMMTVQTVMAGPVMFNVYNGHDGKSLLRSSPTGQLQLNVQGLGEAKSGK